MCVRQVSLSSVPEYVLNLASGCSSSSTFSRLWFSAKSSNMR